MKKLLALLLVLALISIAACQKPAIIEEPPDSAENIVDRASTGDAAVDSVGDGIDDINDVEEELDIEELNDLDSGFEDIENI